MENNHTTPPLQENETPTRPPFLKVLCILTFIGVGIGIIGAVIGWFGSRMLATLMENDPEKFEEAIANAPGSNPATTMLAVEHMNENLIIGLVGSIICLVGALLMWQLKKTGFYIYLVGELAPIVASFAIMGVSVFSGIGILGLILPIVFSILYALNFKHLN
jgi:hypothetical protein